MVTSKSRVQSRIVLHSLLCCNRDTVLLSYPSGSLYDQNSNAFEWVLNLNCNKNDWTVASASAQVNTSALMEVVTHLCSFYNAIRSMASLPRPGDKDSDRDSNSDSDRDRDSNNNEETQHSDINEAPQQRGELVSFDIDLKALVNTLEVVNVYVNPVLVQLSKELTLSTPSVNVVNTYSEANEINVIIKDLRLLDTETPFVEVKDVFIVANFETYTVHCSTQSCQMVVNASHVSVRLRRNE